MLPLDIQKAASQEAVFLMCIGSDSSNYDYENIVILTRFGLY